VMYWSAWAIVICVGAAAIGAKTFLFRVGGNIGCGRLAEQRPRKAGEQQHRPDNTPVDRVR
jgi:hypothetical protein